MQLGEAFAAAAFEDEAVDSWKRALELDPKEARATYNLAIASLKREGMALALPLFRQAGELDPSQDELFFALAGREGGALPTNRSTRQRWSPRRAARLGGRRHSRCCGRGPVRGGELVRLVLDENPDDPEALALAAYAYLKQEAANEADGVRDAGALARYPELPAALYSLGVVYAQAHRTLAATRPASSSRSPSARPEHALVHVLLAESLLGLQRFEPAGKAYRVARAARPGVRACAVRPRGVVPHRGPLRRGAVGDPPRRLLRHQAAGTVLAPLRRVRRGR